MSTTIKVAIADDHEIFRDGLKLMLRKMEGVTLVGEAANGKDLLEIVASKSPNVIITDLKMPVMDGVAVTKHVTKHCPEIGIIALSMYDEEQLIMEVLDAGATGYLLKNCDKEELKTAIQQVSLQQPYYCRQTSAKLAKLIAQSRAAAQKEVKISIEFSEKELEIIRLICKEYSSAEISEALFISIRTLEAQKQKILERMGVKNNVGLVITAIKSGIYIPE